MIKKILPVMLCVCLIFSISAMAANSTDNSDTQTPAAPEEMPMQGGGRQGGGRGGMGMPPAMPDGETPPEMPDGRMQGGRTAPSDIGEAPESRSSEQPQSSDKEAAADRAAGNNGNTENRGAGESQSPDKETATDGAVGSDDNFNRMQRGGMGGQNGMNGNMPENNQNVGEKTGTLYENGILGFVKNYSTPIFSVILLIAAFAFVIFYKRKTF